MGWDVDRAVKHLQDHAEPPYGVGKCARYVREAIEAGGLAISRAGSGSAKDYGPRLTGAGFVALAGDLSSYQKGDVALIDGFSKEAAKGIKKDHPHGHLAMYDGSQWISDFKQTGAKPYPGSDYAKAAPKITIYRYVNPK
ncbi:MAG: CHAP domain-containing protein [Isosphaeraceae bacterium]